MGKVLSPLNRIPVGYLKVEVSSKIALAMREFPLFFVTTSIVNTHPEKDQS